MKSYIIACTLWAIAVLFSILSVRVDFFQTSWAYFFTNIIPLFVSVFYVCFGYSRKSFLLLFFSLLISVAILFPLMPNHRYVILFSGLLLFIPQFYPKDSLENYFVRYTIPALRLLLVVVYLFAFFVKLNVAYLDPQKSCATVFYNNIQSLNSFLPATTLLHYFSIYGSIVIELVLPVLYLLSYYRLALFLGVSFHFVLSLDLYKYFTNFSSIMFFLLLISCGEKIINRFYDFSNEVLVPIFRSVRNIKIVFLALIFLIVFSPMSHYLLGQKFVDLGFVGFVTLRHVLWFLYAAFILLFSLKLILGKLDLESPVVNKQSFKLNFAEIIILLLLVLNGLTPYIGLKTRTGINMYSNLRIEPDFSNHLIVKKSLSLGGYLNDIGLVLGSSDKMYCGGVLYGQTQYPVLEILRALKTCPDEDFVFQYKDKEYSSASRESLILVSEKTNFLERFFLTFKPLGLKAENECIW